MTKWVFVPGHPSVCVCVCASICTQQEPWGCTWGIPAAPERWALPAQQGEHRWVKAGAQRCPALRWSWVPTSLCVSRGCPASSLTLLQPQQDPAEGTVARSHAQRPSAGCPCLNSISSTVHTRGFTSPFAAGAADSSSRGDPKINLPLLPPQKLGGEQQGCRGNHVCAGPPAP